MFQLSHDEVGVRRGHTSTHRCAHLLVVEFVAKTKVIGTKDVVNHFAEEGSGGGGRLGSGVEEKLHSCESRDVSDVGVQGGDIYGDKECVRREWVGYGGEAM